ncbi:unnamed protein product [Allacma fusca]|uniref:Uncharacterized protein n=1 Tax=Allacma fusca TaxID=39272 RepID=A0A8J2KLL3_9HEXA|nr:unnamed protein product [Allacma fusca]
MGHWSEFVVTLYEAFFCVGLQWGAWNTLFQGESCGGEPGDGALERFSDKVMVVGAMTGPGVLPLIKVPHNVKINAAYYVPNVLKPLLEDGMAKLYGKDAWKGVVHHDAASLHAAMYTRAFAAELKTKRA